MLKVRILHINYLVDGILSEVPTKIIYKESDEGEILNIHFEVDFSNNHFISNPSGDTEFAVINLQKVLPKNISIACCQSCRYGNFCPFGDCDNEIHCLKDFTPNDKRDVCDIFANDYNSISGKRRRLLDYCSDYKPAKDDEYYTYNSWNYYIDKEL